MSIPDSAKIWQQQKSKSAGVTLYSDHISLSPELIKICSALESISESPSVKVYKRETRKSVLHVTLPADLGGSFVIKGYPLKRLRNQLRPARFGPMEGRNILQAQSLGIKVPAYLGYFTFRKFGLTKSNGVLMEALEGQKTLMEIAQADQSLATQAFHLAIPTICQFYEKGVNYIDMSPHNLMVADLAQEPVIIDWQNCQFISPKNVHQLILQASQFLRYLKQKLPPHEQDSWTSLLYKECSPEIAEDRFLRLVQHYTKAKRPKKSVRYDLDFQLTL